MSFLSRLADFLFPVPQLPNFDPEYFNWKIENTANKILESIEQKKKRSKVYSKWRLVQYLNDGQCEYQCLTCKSFISCVRKYCQDCGIKFTSEHKCREHTTPRYRYENPDLDFNRPQKEIPSFHIKNSYIDFIDAKDVLEFAKKHSIFNRKPAKVYFGLYNDNFSGKIIEIDEWSKELAKLKEAIKSKGLVIQKEYEHCSSYIDSEDMQYLISSWDDYYEYFPEEIKIKTED